MQRKRVTVEELSFAEMDVIRSQGERRHPTTIVHYNRLRRDANPLVRLLATLRVWVNTW